MLDSAVLVVSRMISIQEKGPRVTYEFEDALMLYYSSRKLEQQNASTRVIDLTSDGLNMV